MSGRVFDVAVSFGTPVTGEISVIKEDDKQTEMTVELPEIQDAELTFTWENTDYAGNFLVEPKDKCKDTCPMKNICRIKELRQMQWKEKQNE